MNSNNVMKSGSKSEINSTSYVFITPKKPKSLTFYREKNSKLGHKILTENKNGIFSFSHQINESTSNKKDDLSFISPCMKTPDIVNKSSCKGVNRNVFSSPYDNFLSQSPFSFENYLNSYSRENENVNSLLNHKRKPQNLFHTKKHVRKFSDPCDLTKSDKKLSLSAKKNLNQSPILNSNLNLNKYFNYNKLELNNNNQIDKNDNNFNNPSKTTNNITSSYEKSPTISFSYNKIFKSLTKSIEKEISLDLSEAKEAIMKEKEFYSYSSLFLEREIYNKKLNFDNDDKRFEVFMELNLNDKNLMNQAIEYKEVKGNSKSNIKKKLFKIEDFYVNNTDQNQNQNQNTNTRLEQNGTPENYIINSAISIGGKKKIFSCLDDCTSTAFNSQKKSKNKNQNDPSRIRKTDSQVLILEELVKSNSVISREMITQASFETRLSFSIVYKWLWDRNNKLKRKLDKQMKNTIESSSILEESEKDSNSEEAESEVKELKNNLIFKVEPNLTRSYILSP